MMFFNNIFSWLIKRRIRQIDFFKNNPTAVQQNLLKNMLVKCSSTKFGGLFSFKDISDYQTFSKKVPLHDYTTIYPLVEEVL
ncbi:MAG: hypothetical protein RL728_1189, partial [Bacteroidota bacterium]